MAYAGEFRLTAEDDNIKIAYTSEHLVKRWEFKIGSRIICEKDKKEYIIGKPVMDEGALRIVVTGANKQINTRMRCKTFVTNYRCGDFVVYDSRANRPPPRKKKEKEKTAEAGSPELLQAVEKSNELLSKIVSLLEQQLQVWSNTKEES